jgi:hypothetical protein
MTTKKFPWGKVRDKFEYDFDGRTMEVIKFHPWKTKGSTVLTGEPNLEEVNYSVDEIHQSFYTIDAAILAWIAYKNLGLNQYALVDGVCRALGINEVSQDGQ